MTRPVFERGDVVATTVHYAGHEKAHIGKVLEIGRGGGRILVGFNEKRGQDWFAASKLKFVVGVDENNTPVLSDARPVEEPSKPAPTKAPPLGAARGLARAGHRAAARRPHRGAVLPRCASERGRRSAGDVGRARTRAHRPRGAGRRSRGGHRARR